MHRFQDMTTYWSKIAEKPTPLSFGTFLWGANFSTTHTLPETRIMRLSEGVHFTIPLSLCWAQYRRVKDRRTDRRTRRCRKDRASIASRGKKWARHSVSRRQQWCINSVIDLIEHYFLLVVCNNCLSCTVSRIFIRRATVCDSVSH